MRRKDREVTNIIEILQIIEKAKVLHLALFDADYPYIVPLHYGYEYTEGILIFYMHCAKEGHKLDLIRSNPNVCIEVESDVELISGGDVACKYGISLPSCGSFLTFRWSGSVPAVRKEKRMYFDAKEFGKRLHDVRTSSGITQEELAVRLGLASKQHVSRMENGERSCSIDLLIELSCILHVSTDYLLMGSEPSKEEVKNDLLSIISELSTIAKKI